MVTSESGLLPRTVSESMVLPHPRSVLMSVAQEAARDHTDPWGLGCNLWQGGCVRAVLLPGPCCLEWPVLTQGSPGHGCCKGSGSKMMSVAPVTIESHANDWEFGQPSETILVS
ncbi:hypothetical protein H671_2g6278 [Cricetulus griseus]|uniref:Uncharacterized protein n=1 Tax=Cricetulus griseus TaxID=10029 RepID=A0A061IEJ9_CRIGR|nr:hypothetical protein H671_2g6278 [Cricetulus griseus]